MTQKLNAEPDDALDTRPDHTDEIHRSGTAPLTDSPDPIGPSIEPPAAAARARQLRLPTFGLSATTLVATALAAITATVAASFLGVAGTVVGAALFSVLTAAGKEVFGQSLRRTREAVRDAVPATLIAPRPAAADTRSVPVATDTRSLPVAGTAPPGPLPARRAGAVDPAWKRTALAAIAVFVAVLAVVTGVELLAGRPLADVVRGDAGHGTTFFGGKTQPVKTVTPTVTPPTVTVTPTVVTRTPTVTETAPTPTTTTTTPSVSTSAAPSSSSSTGAGGSTGGGSVDRNGTPNHRTASASTSASP